jgi:HEAT repeat-containing protein 5
MESFLISEMVQIVLTAAHCAKTLILASHSGGLVLRQCTKILIPSLVEYIINIAALAAEGTIKDFHVSAVAEIWKAFSALFNTITEPQRLSLHIQLGFKH